MKKKNGPTSSKIAGVGLRSPHIQYVIENHKKISKDISWFEVHSENYFNTENFLFSNLLKIRENFPISLHSVGNCLGSAQKINLEHLEKLKNLIAKIDPFLVSDHISWGAVNNIYLNDLLPFPYNKKSLEIISDNISTMQDFLNREISIENPSAYLTYNNSEIEESDFINSIIKKTGCKLLLDVNNIYVSSQNNQNFDPVKYLNNLNKNIVSEIHLAGHSQHQIFNGNEYQKILIDTHNNFVCKEVWQLYKIAIGLFKNTPTLIEWDQDIPDFKVLLAEAKMANKIANN